MRKRFVPAVVLAGLLAGCGSGGGDGAAASTPCVGLEQSALDIIAGGLKSGGTVSAGQAVEMPAASQKFGYTNVVAVKVGTQTAILAVDDVKAPALITVTNDGVSGELFSWSDSATSGSQMATFQKQVYGSKSASAAAACLK